jgi:hypothetical protein
MKFSSNGQLPSFAIVSYLGTSLHQILNAIILALIFAVSVLNFNLLAE